MSEKGRYLLCNKNRGEVMKKNILFMVILMDIVFCVSFIIKRDETRNSISRYDSSAATLSFNEKTTTLKPNETIDVSRLLNLQNVSSRVTYIVNNDEVASITTYGLVKAKSAGTAIISAIDDLGRTANMRLIVIDKKNEGVLPEKIILNEKEKDILIGQTYKINYELYPSNVTNKELYYKSSNSNVASVNNGIVLAKNVGSTIISVCLDNICSDLTINVKEVLLDIISIKVYPSDVTLKVNQNISLNIIYTPNNTERIVKWTSSDETIVKVDNGKIFGLRRGSAYVTATIDGKSSDCFVSVIDNESTNNPTKPDEKDVTSVILDKSFVELEVGSTFKVVSTILPNNATNKKLVYSTSNKAIFTVSEAGLITTISSGTGTLNVCSSNNICSKMKVVVKPKTISASSVSLNIENTSLEISEVKQLKANILPLNTTNKSIIWVSSDNKIVSVSNGLIKGLSSGKATVTAITSNGLMAKSNITVLPNNSVFKYGEELNGTSNYCLKGGITSNKKYSKSDINSELQEYINDAYEYSLIIGDIDPKRAQVLAAAYFLGFNSYCKIRYMEGYDKPSTIKGWWGDWTYKTGIDSVTFIKWAYYQVFEKNYERYILGRYKKEFNRTGLWVSDFIDIALPGDVLVQEEKYTGKTRVAMILSVDTNKNEVTIIHSKDEGIKIETINNKKPTYFTTLADMSRIFN